MTNTNTNFTVFHADHGITGDQMQYIQGVLVEVQVEDGFFIHQVDMVGSTVPCGLYGPAMGDEPVVEAEMFKRSEDRPADRMVKAPFREVGYVQCIGIREGKEFKLFTVYGGPLAPQNPEDPGCQDVEASKKFWAEHALAY